MRDGHLMFCIQLAMAAVLGGIIGLERKLAGKHAGLRTNLLICVGAAFLTHVSMIGNESFTDKQAAVELGLF